MYGIIPFLLSIAAWEVVLCTLQSAVPGTVVPGTRYKTLLTLEGPGKKDLLFSLLINQGWKKPYFFKMKSLVFGFNH